MIKKLIGLTLFLLVLFLMPQKGADALRFFAASSASSFSKTKADPNRVDLLELENQVLKTKLLRLNGQNDFKGIPARVVFREPVNWSSCFWISIGKREVEEGSPVVIGNKVVGIIDEVGKSRSKVRLITDRRLPISVRAVRGGEQNRLLVNQLKETMHILDDRKDLGGAKEMNHVLNAFLESIDIEEQDLYLAKGEIRGASRPLWRTLGDKLKGIGFHYYFADEKGPARELKSDPPLICEGDVLVTTGMDGLFPPDLQVGIVTKVFALREGETTFSIEAKCCVSNMSELSDVLVLPKNSF